MAKLPFAEKAVVPREKLLHYLLNEFHAEGASKAVFFQGYGYSKENFELLSGEFLRLAKTFDAKPKDANQFGKSFEIEGEIDTPNRIKVGVKSIWFLETDGEAPRLISA